MQLGVSLGEGEQDMNEQPVIMVQLDEPQWTWEVLDSACALAHSSSGRMVLVKMVQVKRFLYLGTKMGYLELEKQERQRLQAYTDWVANNGVPCAVEFFQYWDRFGAIADAASQMGASTVFARLPRSIIPFWSDARFEVLRQRLAQHDLALFNKAVALEQ
jgi:hypothetical protein